MEAIGRYRILKRLGGGGFGEVFLGEDPQIGRLVAIKVFRPKDENLIAFATSSDEEGLRVLRDRFLREAQILADLEDEPHVVGVLEFGELPDGDPWYAMPYLPRSLADEIGRDVFDARALAELPEEEHPCALPLEQALKVLEQVLEGLAAAHVKGLVHRDVKPANVLLSEAGRVRIGDFGIAKAPDGQHSTVSHLGLGSRNYMAPEQRESAKHVDARADIYAVGVLGYRILTGRLPIGRFADPNVHQSGLSAALNDVVLRAMEADPADRYADATAMLTALQQALAQQPITDGSQTGTGTFAGGAAPKLRSELAPLVERIEAALFEYGEVPAASRETLEALAALQDLGPAELDDLIEEVAKSHTERLKPVRNFRELVRQRVATHGAGLPAAVRSALKHAGESLGWEAERVEAMIAEALAQSPGCDKSAQSADAVQTQSRAAAASKSSTDSQPSTPPTQQRSSVWRSLPITAGLLLTATLAGGGWWLFGNELEPEPPRREVSAGTPRPAERPASAQDDRRAAERRAAEEREAREAQQQRDRERAQQEEIRSLLAQAGEDLRANRLMLPAGGNAFARYQAVLAMESDNREAREGLAQIVGRYTSLFEAALGEGDLERAGQMLARAEEVRPTDGRLAGMRRELSRAREARLAEERAAAEEAERQATSQAAARRAAESRREPGNVFRDRLDSGGQGPEMVVIPAGEFRMGSPRIGKITCLFPTCLKHAQRFSNGQ